MRITNSLKSVSVLCADTYENYIKFFYGTGSVLDTGTAPLFYTIDSCFDDELVIGSYVFNETGNTSKIVFRAGILKNNKYRELIPYTVSCDLLNTLNQLSDDVSNSAVELLNIINQNKF